MKKTILVAGYTKSSHINNIRGYFPNDEVVLACAYTREPKSEPKKQYLEKFDVTYDLTQESDKERLQKDSQNIDCITCTQERDMGAYILALQITSTISAVQAQNYKIAIDKHECKESLQVSHPELVPSHHVVTDDLLKQLDSLTYPQVIKPSGLAGSILIHIVHSADEFRKHYETFAEKMKEIGKEHYGKEISIIAEEYISGPQYSANVYINASGEIVFCPLVRVITPQEVGIDDTYSVFQYTTDELPDTEVQSLQKAISVIVSHFNIKNTSAHFDAVLHKGQWKFFELGLRIGGNRRSLFELSHGMDHFYNDLLNRLQIPIVIPQMKKVACILQKASTDKGTLKSISYTRNICMEKPPLISEHKIAKIGTPVAPVSLGGGTIIRQFIVGKNQQDVLHVSRELFESIHFDVQ